MDLLSMSVSEFAEELLKIFQPVMRIALCNNMNKQECNTRALAYRSLKETRLDRMFQANTCFDMCFCNVCCQKRGDVVYAQSVVCRWNGAPNRKNTTATGWFRFGVNIPPHALKANASSNWHVAFHGTTKRNAAMILQSGELKLPGSATMFKELTKHNAGHFTGVVTRMYMGRKVEFDSDNIYASPSMLYAKEYAVPYLWKCSNGDMYVCRLVLQLYMRPGTYEIRPESMHANTQTATPQRFDPWIINDNIEFCTKLSECAVISGVLLNITPVTPEQPTQTGYESKKRAVDVDSDSHKRPRL